MGAHSTTPLIGCREEAAGRFEGTPAGLVGPRLELRWGRVDTAVTGFIGPGK